ncbi:ATPase SWSAP1 [Hyperolius riggenbachi]|uniref:ATPase SWSAP1 n=1 Tax=Hyperolius riggenbachi TaxID=752182 RepID=UPI0035A35DA4
MSALLQRLLTELSDPPAAFPGPSDVTAAGCGRQGAPLLLLGPPGSGKSGLLFMAAVLAAEEGAGPVIFLSREPLQEVPRGGKAARDPLTLKLIRFVYPPSLKELLQFFSTLHITPLSLSLIVVDGLERYLPSSCSPGDGALLCALMLDSVSYLRCGLVVSAVPNPGGSDGAFLAVERYFPSQCHLHHVTSPETEGRQFKISFLSPHLQWNLQVEQSGRLRISSSQGDNLSSTEATGNT